MQGFLFDAEPEVKPYLPGYPCVISSDGLYRYILYRVWNEAEKPRLVLWICLNPSTADAEKADPSLTRMMGFSRSWGYDGICLVNLFAFRSTDPAAMKLARDAVGDDCDYWIVQAADHAEMCVAGWGTHGGFQNRDKAVLALFKSLGKDLHCLRLTSEGHPAHPLYQPADLPTVLFHAA